MARIICMLFVAATLTVSVLVPSAEARGCDPAGDGQSSLVLCREGGGASAGSSWTWVFVAGWASMVSLLLLTERCARRKGPEMPMARALGSFAGASRQPS